MVTATCLSFFFLASNSTAGTVPTGGEFIGQFAACPDYPPILLTCPPFPADVMMMIETAYPNSPVGNYSLTAWLVSDATGQQIAIGSNFDYWITWYGADQWGVFGYNGLAAGFPMPGDAGFYGPNRTFSVLFKNTGAAFDFLVSPVSSVFVNLDEDNTRYVGSTLAVSVSDVPESPSIFGAACGILTLSMAWRKQRRVS
jgi:hypothetical protein